MNDDTPDEEICETMSALQNLVGTEGVDLVMREHRLDAIGILMDSPICSIAAATGGFIQHYIFHKTNEPQQAFHTARCH